MIRKSGIRFSEKIMLKQKARAECRSNHNSFRSNHAIRQAAHLFGAFIFVCRPTYASISSRAFACLRSWVWKPSEYQL
jgi:hypothetical protein